MEAHTKVGTKRAPFYKFGLSPYERLRYRRKNLHKFENTGIQDNHVNFQFQMFHCFLFVGIYLLFGSDS